MVRKITSKRANENTPLAPAIRTTNQKVLADRLLRIQSTFGSNSNIVNRSKRTRSTSGIHDAKQAFERSKRRNDAKRKLKFRLKVIDNSTPDVEMVDGTSTTAKVSVSPFVVVEELPRPFYKEINMDLLRSIVPDLGDTNIDYLVDMMSLLCPDMLQSISSIQLHVEKSNALPKEIKATVNGRTEILPSHILAVRRSPGVPPLKAEETGREVKLYPVHSIVLAFHCAHLPTPPPTLPAPVMPENPEELQQIQLPVMPLIIPSPETFPHLLRYLYTQDLPMLTRSLLPSNPPESWLDKEKPEILKAFAEHLAATFSPERIAGHLRMAQRLWMNLCSLGIFDEELWDANDGVWKVLIEALTIGAGAPTVVPLAPLPQAAGPQPSSSSSSSSSSPSSSEPHQQSDVSPPVTSTPPTPA